jgi:hypothetical protein
MSAGPCVRCGAPEMVQHHPTGKLGGTYVDAAWVLDLCAACHGAEHAARGRLGLEHAGPTPATTVERIALVLRRVAVTFGRLARLPTLGPFLAGLAGLLRRFADGLDGHVAALDGAVPGWREAIA